MALSASPSIQRRILGRLVNLELERMWKETVVAQYEALFCHFAGELWKT
jgi:hypothetical protein